MKAHDATSTKTCPERFPGDIDRRAMMKLPVEERDAIIRAQVEAIADEYNHEIDHEWLDADLGERGAAVGKAKPAGAQ